MAWHAIPETETDAREGRMFTIIMQVGDDTSHTGEHPEIDRPNKLVFTWETAFSIDGSSVTLNFSDLGGSKTHIDLTLIKFIDEEARTNHDTDRGNIPGCLNDILRQGASQAK